MDTQVISAAAVMQSSRPDTEPNLARLKDAAIKLEATFLAEMLKAGGLAAPPDSFGGGPGEDQFSSILVQEQAELIAKAGGIGLAESIFDALRRNADAHSK